MTDIKDAIFWHFQKSLSTPGGAGANEKKLSPDFEDFCSHTFCNYAVIHADLWNIRQLVKISPSGNQNPDPYTFLVSSLIKRF